jgi:hypothetical protein
MAHFAEIGINNKVLQVIVVSNEEVYSVENCLVALGCKQVITIVSERILRVLDILTTVLGMPLFHLSRLIHGL